MWLGSDDSLVSQLADRPARCLGGGCRQLRPVTRRFLPAGGAMQAIPEEAIDEAGHRDTVTLRFMEERRDDGPGDDGHVVGRLCHQGYMP